MDVDWDGTHPHGSVVTYAMHSLIGLKDRFDVAFACDTDHDRHGVVRRAWGCCHPNHYLAACDHYLFREPARVEHEAAVGKTSRVEQHDRPRDRRRSAARSTKYLSVQVVRGRPAGRPPGVRRRGERRRDLPAPRRNGVDDRQGRDRRALLAAEMTARTGRDPGEIYARPDRASSAIRSTTRIDAPATSARKRRSLQLSPERFSAIAGRRANPARRLTTAPGNGQPIGGLKVAADGGWFAARPSGTEEIYKIYAENLRGLHHPGGNPARAQQTRGGGPGGRSRWPIDLDR